MASQEKSMPFIKNLASSDRKTRTAALDSLRTFLSAKHILTALTTLDILKLWKGLFYALWMCDRPLPQQQLCADLAGLIWVLPSTPNTITSNKKDEEEEESTKVVISWLRGFWATMAREWTTGIDVLRMEKFLLLVRRVLGASLVWMQARQGDDDEDADEKKAPKSSPTKRSTRGAAATAAGKKRTANGETKTPTTATTTTTTTNDATARWNKTRVDAMLALLSDWPFRPEEETEPQAADQYTELMPKMVPVGLKLHALDIWVDEAQRAGLLPPLPADNDNNDNNNNNNNNQEEQSPSSSSSSKTTLSSTEVLHRLHALVTTLRAETRSPAVRIRSKESLADDRLPWNQKATTTEGEEEGEGNDGEGDEWGGLDD